MPQFSYTAFSEDGKRDQGVVEFATETQAWDSLTGLGLTIVELAILSPAKASTLRFSGLISKQIPFGIQADVAEQFSVLTEANLQTTEIVALIARGTTHSGVQRCFERMERLLADGMSFDQAFEQAARGFTTLFGAMLRLSQTISNPESILRNLATYLRQQQRLKSQLSGALLYPMILLFGGIAIFLLVILYLAPALKPMFTSLGRDVPGAIGLFLAIGDGLKAYGLHLALGLLLLCSLVIFGMRRRLLSMRALTLQIPMIGSIIRDSALARLTRSLNLMLAAGIPLSPALRDTGLHLKTDVFAPDFLRAAEAVQSGDSASSVFAQTRSLPIMFKELFAIGEQTNSLVTITATMAAVLEDRAERQSQRVVQLVAPLITLAMGGALALLVYSIMDAILSVNDLAF